MQAFAGKEEMFQLADNIILYSVDKTGFYSKDQIPSIKANPGIRSTRTIDVARIRYDGNWDPEPGGWRRLANVIHNADQVDLKIDIVDPAAGELKGKKIAHLTGTGAVQLSEAAQAAIKTFIAGGGTLVIDAAGGNQLFAASIQKQLRAWFPDDAVQLAEPLPPDCPLYTQGPSLTKVGYRRFARSVLGELDAPRLRGIRVKGRLAVVFSAEDLSVGLVGQAVDGIIGYDPATATLLMRKILLASN
jgi:hypothetical protein